ncbi:MAG: hypothetical protein JWQ43_2141 [Glaciihabitans sp.]|nr:hypothetical protein [Glaciihabitans sp.]
MFSIITQALRLAAARWPALLAWYLAGWLARYLLIELAATVGSTSALFGLMLLPLAVLARLGSYLAMFLVLRSAMPAFSELSDRGEDSIDRTRSLGEKIRSGTVTQLFLVSIVPFFAFYAALNLFAADTAQYTASALSKINPFADNNTLTAVNLGLDAATITVVVLAFAGRFALKHYSAKLPRWTNLIAVYLEALWVYLTIYLVVLYVEDFWAWVDGRAATRWYEDFWARIGEYISPLAQVWSGLQWAVGEVGALALLPLAWLAIAGVVYGRALAKPAITFRPQSRYYTGIRARVSALPRGVSRRLKDVGVDFFSRFTPVTNALVLIWRAGVVPVGLFVLAYTVLESARTWLDLLAVRVIGPHDLQTWWMNFDDILSFVVALLIEPIRLCLIAAAYDFCLRKLEERREAKDLADPPASTGSGAAAPATA